MIFKPKNSLKKTFQNKDILVTGGCGSIGTEIVKQLLKLRPKRVRVFDQNESGHFHLQKSINHSALRSLVGDIRDKSRLERAIKGVDIVFHAAALKHVPLCEYNPFEAIKTNVEGTQNIIDVARSENVEKVIFISTDKAANPINTMGATKLLGEKLVINASAGDYNTLFSCVRFGNVLNSDGSVIPIFKEQIKQGGPITITNHKMTRFFMSLSEAVSLVLKTAQIMRGREIFILKMKSLKIVDLAEVLIEELAPLYNLNPKNIKIQKIGVRPGEKLSEVLLTKEEMQIARDHNKFFVLKPHIIAPHYHSKHKFLNNNHQVYDSAYARHLNKDEIRKLLHNYEMISDIV